MANPVTKTITAENVFSDPIWINEATDFVFELYEVGSGTIYLQRDRGHLRGDDDPAGATWSDYQAFTAVQVATEGYEPVGAWYRFGIKTGGFTSGTFSGYLQKANSKSARGF